MSHVACAAPVTFLRVYRTARRTRPAAARCTVGCHWENQTAACGGHVGKPNSSLRDGSLTLNTYLPSQPYIPPPPAQATSWEAHRVTGSCPPHLALHAVHGPPCRHASRRCPPGEGLPWCPPGLLPVLQPPVHSTCRSAGRHAFPSPLPSGAQRFRASLTSLPCP